MEDFFIVTIIIRKAQYSNFKSHDIKLISNQTVANGGCLSKLLLIKGKV